MYTLNLYLIVSEYNYLNHEIRMIGSLFTIEKCILNKKKFKNLYSLTLKAIKVFYLSYIFNL